MPKAIDYTDKKIGRVTILSLVERKHGGAKWNCICDCKKEFSCWAASFRNGDKFECPDCVIERRRGIDLTGRKFGRWTVLKRTVDIRNRTVWHCRCDCGNEGYIATGHLGNPKKSMSCGCLARKKKSKWANPSLYPKASGLSTTKFYSLRTKIIHKCYKKGWPTYNLFGEKGITVCELWRNSAKDMYDWAISNGWKEKTSIVLKEGKKEFNPENVYLIHTDDLRGIIAKDHAEKITYKGQSLRLAEWSKILDIDIVTLRKRLTQFPSVDEAFEAPHRKMTFLKNEDLKKQCIEMFKQVRSYKKVGTYFGVTGAAVAYHIKNMMDKKPTWNRVEHVKDEEIEKLLKKGYCKNQIANILNTNWTCIDKRVKRMNKVMAN